MLELKIHNPSCFQQYPHPVLYHRPNITYFKAARREAELINGFQAAEAFVHGPDRPVNTS